MQNANTQTEQSTPSKVGLVALLINTLLLIGKATTCCDGLPKEEPEHPKGEGGLKGQCR